MTLTPNSEVSRTVEIRVGALALSELMEKVCADSPPNPVRIVFTENGASVWTHDMAKTVQILATDYPLDGLKVKEPCVLLVDPRSFGELLATKFDSAVQITTTASEPIIIKAKGGANVVYHPADEDDCHCVPDHWVMDNNSDGWTVFTMFDDETATSRVTISREELHRGIIDMQVAKAPYVVFKFEHGGSSCASGHWGSKTNRSYSAVEAKVEGDDCEVCFTENLGMLVTKFASDTVILQKHSRAPFVIIESGAITMVASEAQRES
jgi:hypothetical protein